ncbi:ACP S-malonyltransferase [Leptospira sp. GIMC2001]|uniref:ACP S-malonyltransferase n=1 Tax=Leptospira sp. GIMC2001 TaxID=1513297 RepID=UPI002349F77A|nr:ACP S-malonyltransferase [Leptospira sp. GIMC2001]WCL49966.1 ACP S-malonyltransferase [Leptospira sp. GIMC2001]
MSSAPILENLRSENKKIFIQFGGQGSPWIKELSKLYQEPSLKSFFDMTFETIAKEVKRTDDKVRFDQGFDLKSWLENPESAPLEDYLCRACISVPTIMAAQVGNYLLLVNNGYKTADLIAQTAAGSGHSQGIIASCLIALGKDGDDFLQAYSDFLSFEFWMGYRGQLAYPDYNVSQELVDKNLAIGDKNPSPMVAVIGYSKDELEERVNAFNKENNLTEKTAVYISLYNTPDSMILSTIPESLLAFRTKFKAEMDERKAKFVYLKTTAPFHCPFMNSTWPEFKEKDYDYLRFNYKGSDLKFPIYGIFDGKNLQETPDLKERLFKTVLIEPLYWDKAVSVLWTNSEISTILDFGPSTVAQKLTGGHLKAKEIEKQSLCVSSPKELKVLLGTSDK